jgi:hypothetical protein
MYIVSIYENITVNFPVQVIYASKNAKTIKIKYKKKWCNNLLPPHSSCLKGLLWIWRWYLQLCLLPMSLLNSGLLNPYRGSSGSAQGSWAFTSVPGGCDFTEGTGAQSNLPSRSRKSALESSSGFCPLLYQGAVEDKVCPGGGKFSPSLKAQTWGLWRMWAGCRPGLLEVGRVCFVFRCFVLSLPSSPQDSLPGCTEFFFTRTPVLLDWGPLYTSMTSY